MKIACLLCGQSFLRITNSHLRKRHDLAPEKYMEMFDIPSLLPTGQLHLCACGCGGAVQPSKKYLPHHHKISPPKHECLCGCGKMVRANKSYVHGHQIRVNNPAYKDGRYAKLEVWRRAVLVRDNYTCQKCFGRKGFTRLCPHHIKPKKEFPEFIYDVDNGITLCSSCHASLHSSGVNSPFYGVHRFGADNPMYGKRRSPRSVPDDVSACIHQGGRNV